eukprot:6183952-Pleurochrysis_carterae.AAC.3
MAFLTSSTVRPPELLQLASILPECFGGVHSASCRRDASALARGGGRHARRGQLHLRQPAHQGYLVCRLRRCRLARAPPRLGQRQARAGQPGRAEPRGGARGRRPAGGRFGADRRRVWRRRPALHGHLARSAGGPRRRLSARAGAQGLGAQAGRRARAWIGGAAAQFEAGALDALEADDAAFLARIAADAGDLCLMTFRPSPTCAKRILHSCTPPTLALQCGRRSSF